MVRVVSDTGQFLVECTYFDAYCISSDDARCCHSMHGSVPQLRRQTTSRSIESYSPFSSTAIKESASPSRMWSNNNFFTWIYTVATVGKIAHGLQSPDRRLDQHVSQQILGSSPNAENHHLSILDDPGRIDELFWSLTTSDVVQAFDGFAASEVGIKPHRIVLGYHTDSQSPRFGKSRHKGSRHPASLEVSMSTIGGFPVFHAPIAVGSPAQPFNAWLNMSLDGLYVRSSVCDKRDCGTGFKYKPKKSTTRTSLDQRFEVNPGGWTIGGNVSTDTLHLVSVEIEEAMVGEIDKYEGENMFYYVMSFVADG